MPVAAVCAGQPAEPLPQPPVDRRPRQIDHRARQRRARQRALEVGDAAEPRQLDVGDVRAEQPPGEGVSELVQQDRQQQADDDDEPGRHHLRVAGGEVGIGEEQQHQHEHHVEIDRDAGDAADLHARRTWVRSAPALVAHRQRPQPQRVEPDEPLGVLLVVGALVVLEGDEAGRIERLGALAPGDDDVALVELEAHVALDMLLALVDQRLQHLALGREPEAVVDQLGVARHQLVLEMAGAAVERDRFDGPVRGEQDRAARRLVHAARLHADEAVLDQIDAADAVVAAELVEPGEQRGGRHRLAVEAHRIALWQSRW